MAKLVDLVPAFENVIEKLDDVIEGEFSLSGFGGFLAELEVCRDELIRVLELIKKRKADR
jgi:hypothetical protein